MAAQGQSSQDIALLGLGSVMTDIALATESLALAIGHGLSVHAPYRRTVVSTRECAATFGWAADTLGWLIERLGAEPEKELAQALHSSLDELVARYPSAPVMHTAEAAPPSA